MSSIKVLEVVKGSKVEKPNKNVETMVFGEVKEKPLPPDKFIKSLTTCLEVFLNRSTSSVVISVWDYGRNVELTARQLINNVPEVNKSWGDKTVDEKIRIVTERFPVFNGLKNKYELYKDVGCYIIEDGDEYELLNKVLPIIDFENSMYDKYRITEKYEWEV